MPRARIWKSMVGLLLALAACRPLAPEAPSPPPWPTATALPVLLRLGLSSSAAPLSTLVGPAYGATTTRARIQFVSGNETALWSDLAAGQLDAILVHGIPAGRRAWFTPVALDGLIVVVHPENPVRDLEPGQVQRLFAGAITNWREVGGLDGPVHLVAREADAGPRLLFSQLIMGERRLAITATVQPTYERLLETVAADTWAVGYAMMADPGSTVPVRLAGMAATPESVTDQSYPLTTPLYFAALEEPTGGDPARPDEAGAELRAFLAWLQHGPGQEVLAERYGRLPNGGGR